ncbi:TPR repeat protein [Aquimarina sp. MAR_2010_214]|uniref:tetratricopeptide repeat protein n=1 Tax=Aquimarina sp. MAR_2010_214 TaxID=1250026 RepID=UPI000C704B51|nr:tetratricopeptide repeat protein [Aquimarina sp. MAR_2010_214]PKV50256.1 TPR repeat protein [Aquimarina sp. MAR_2010_214]
MKKISRILISTLIVLFLIGYAIKKSGYLDNNKENINLVNTSDTDFSLINLCSSGASLKFQDLPETKLLTNIGNSSWKISTKNDSAQAYFNQGINALHAFWDVEAFRAFKKGLKFDPQNAMMHWGLAKSISQTVGELRDLKKESSIKAVQLSKNAKSYEYDFIAAYNALAKNGKNAYKKKMEEYLVKYPNQINAKLFYASFLSSGVSTYLPNGIPTKENLRGQELLKEVMLTYPKSSALHHYWIHAIENSTQPEKALESAKVISSLAPASGHITHMPGHIYYRIGEYDLANKAFYHSLTIDSIYMSTSKIGSINNWNYVHNLDYLVASCAESGKYKEGLKWANRISNIAIDRARLMSRGSGYILFGAYTSIPRFHIRFEEWEKATKSIDTLIQKIPWRNSKAIAYFEGVKQYAEGMFHLESNEIEKASINLEQLLKTKNDLENNPSKISADWYYRYALKILAVNAQELEGLIHYKEGKTIKAIKLLEEACITEKEIGYWEPPHYTRPVSESLAWVYLQEGKLNETIEAYKEALKLRPKNGHVQFALAKALETLKADTIETKKAYQQFILFWKNADDFNQRLSRAKKYSGSNTI